MSELREGFEAWWAESRIVPSGCFYATDNKVAAQEAWDAALAYLKQHNDFARRVREVAVRGLGASAPWANLREIKTMCDEELAELAKDEG